MSHTLFSYFKKTNDKSVAAPQVPSALTAVTGISENELSIIVEEIGEASQVKQTSNKRVTYKETDKIRITNYANQHTVARAVKHFRAEFPKLKESTVRPWLKTFRSQLEPNTNDSAGVVKIGKKRGRPLILPDELDSKLRSFLVHLRTAGGTVNRNVIYGVLMGLIKSDLQKWGSYLDFNVTDGWIDYLYRRMYFSRRCATTSSPVITRAIWNAIRHLFLHDIAETVLKYQIPDKLIMNLDQTP